MSTSEKPFQWTIDNVKSSIGDGFSMTFGESCSSTLGINASIVVGTYATIVCDPTEFLKLVGPLGPLLNKFLGRQKLMMGPHYTYNFGELMNLTIGGENRTQLGELATKTALAWSRVASLAALASMVFFGDAAPKLKSQSEATHDIEYAAFGSAFFLALVAGCYALLLAAGNAIADSVIEAGAMAYTVYLGLRANPAVVAGLANNSVAVASIGLPAPQQGEPHDLDNTGGSIMSEPLEPVRNDVFPGSVMEVYQTFSLTSTEGAVVGVGKAPGTVCIVSMDILPENGITLMQGEPKVGPLLTMNATGIKLSYGGARGRPGATPEGATLSYGPSDLGMSITLNPEGITLKAGPTSQLKLTPEMFNLQSLTLALKALTALQVETVELTETASGPVSRVGAVTSMM